MDSKLLCSILQYADLPISIRSEVISRYAPQYSSHLCANQYLGSAQTLLVTEHLSPEDAIILSRSPNVGTLRALLDLPDLAETVLRNILDVWELCEEDQLRFVAHPLRPYIADQVVAQKPFNDVPRAIAAFSSSHEVHVQWLRTHPLSDDELLKHLDSAADDDTIFALQGFLLERPALRPIALRHSNPALRAMACWATITPGDEELAVSVATKLNQYKTPPALGLLAQPNIPSALRGPLWRSLSAVTKQAAISNGAQPNITPPFRLQGLISEAPTESIDRILFDLADHSHKFIALAVKLSYLHELCANTNLAPPQAEKLISVLVSYVGLTQGLARDLVTRDLVALLDAISPKVAPALALRRRNLSPVDLRPPSSLKRPRYAEHSNPIGLKVGPTMTPSELRPLVAVLNPAIKDSPAFGAWRATLFDTPTSRALSANQVFELTTQLTDVLGAATTTRSKRSWMIFLSLVQVKSAPTIHDAITTAKTLARAETTNAGVVNV